MKASFIALWLCMLAASLCWGAGADDIVGVWYNQERDAKIQIAPCEDKYCGKVVWLKEPNYPPNSKEGIPGTEKLDNNNPDPALRTTPRLGLEIMRGFRFAGDDVWKDGKVYDPKNGKTYNGKITMVSPTELNLRGFVGVSLFGRTAKWTKAE